MLRISEMNSCNAQLDFVFPFYFHAAKWRCFSFGKNARTMGIEANRAIGILLCQNLMDCKNLLNQLFQLLGGQQVALRDVLGQAAARR